MGKQFIVNYSKMLPAIKQYSSLSELRVLFCLKHPCKSFLSVVSGIRTQSQSTRDSENLFQSYNLISPERGIERVGGYGWSMSSQSSHHVGMILWLPVAAETEFSVLSMILMNKSDPRTDF